jgi:uncharacterized radical SAM superfamily protein
VIDPFDLFYVNVNLEVSSRQELDAGRRITDTSERLRLLEQRHERMKLITVALWQLLKAHTGLTDADLRQYIEKVDLADGKLDGKITGNVGAMDCPHCARRILKTAVICPWCSKRLQSESAFEAT